MNREILYGDNEATKRTTQSILVYAPDQTLRLLRPIMPFVIKEIWEKAPHQGESLVAAEYPAVHEESNDEAAVQGMGVLKEVTRPTRNIQVEVNTPFPKPITLLIKTNDTEVEEFLTANTSYLERFYNSEELVISREAEAPELAVSAVLTGAKLFLPLAGLINIEEGIIRLEKELDKQIKEIKRVQGKLSDGHFASNAPDEVVEAERAKEKGYLEKRETVKGRAAQLRSI